MAADVYLEIESVTGESKDSAHKDWIEITSVTWGEVSRKARPHRRRAATRRNVSTCAKW